MKPVRPNTLTNPQNSNAANAKKAPPAYRPQPTPKVLQRKVAVQHPVAPPVFRPQPVPKVLQTKTATAGPPGPTGLPHRAQQINAPQAPRTPPKAPPIYRPAQSAPLQAKAAMSLKHANHPAARNPNHMMLRPQVIQRAEGSDDYGYDTDEDEDCTPYEWTTLTQRPKLPTIFSYAIVAHGSKPASSEGPHSFASVALRYKYEKIIKAGDWAQLARELKHLGNKAHVTVIMATEAPNADARKLARYLNAYESQFAVATTAVAARVNITDAAMKVLAVENMHPYGTYGWKTAMSKQGSQKGAGHGSSKAKGEKMVMRPNKRPSATRTNRLIDRGCLSVFTDGIKDHLQHNLSFIFECPSMNLGTYLENAGTNSNVKKRNAKKRKGDPVDSDEERPAKKARVVVEESSSESSSEEEASGAVGPVYVFT